MKKICFYSLVIMSVLFFTSLGFSATSGNPNDVQSPHGPGFWNMGPSGTGAVKTSGEADFVFKKELTGRSGTSDIEERAGRWYLGKFSYTIADRVDVFGLLGASETSISWKEGGHKVKGDSDFNFAWGLGGRLFLYEIPKCKVRFTVNGLYRYFTADLEKVLFDDADITTAAGDKKFTKKEWQAGVNISREFKLSEATAEEAAIILVPYIGVRYSDSIVTAKITYSDTEYKIGDAENDVKIGMPVGADLLIGNNLSFNVEGRFFDETALSAGLTLKY